MPLATSVMLVTLFLMCHREEKQSFSCACFLKCDLHGCGPLTYSWDYNLSNLMADIMTYPNVYEDVKAISETAQTSLFHCIRGQINDKVIRGDKKCLHMYSRLYFSTLFVPKFNLMVIFKKQLKKLNELEFALLWQDLKVRIAKKKWIHFS